MTVIELKQPLKTAQGMLNTLTLRRPKVRDLKMVQAQGKSEAEQEIALLAALTEEQLTPEDLEDMDLADYSAVQATFRAMLDS